MSATFSVNKQKFKEKEIQRKEDLKKTWRFIITLVVMLSAVIVAMVIGVAEDVKKENTLNYLWQKYGETYEIESKLSNKEEKELDKNIEFAYHIVTDEGDEKFIAGVKNNNFFDTLKDE